MTSELREQFDRYWSDRVPGMVEYTRYVLNNDTDFNHTLRVFLKDVPVGSRVLDMMKLFSQKRESLRSRR